MKKHILIVEDELLIAEDIKMNLEELHYKVVGIAIKAAEAFAVLESNKVDLALLDINIKGELDGVELGAEIKKRFSIPIIYLTSNSDKRTVERAVATEPSGYIVKPYNKTDLYTTLALSLHDKTEESPYSTNHALNSKEIAAFFKISGSYTKIHFKNIDYFRTAGNYIEIHQKDTVDLVRMTVSELFKVVAAGNFLRIHKSYIVNTDKITELKSNAVLVGEKRFPLGGRYKEEVFKTLKLF